MTQRLDPNEMTPSNNNGDVLTTVSGRTAWAAPTAGSGGGAAGSVSGSDTTKAASSTVVNAATTTTLASGTTFAPTADTLLTITSTCSATNTGTAQGAYIDAVCTYNFNGATFLAAVTQTGLNQVVKTPLSSTPIEGTNIIFLKAGKTYTLAYQLKAGTGSPAVTFTNVQSAYRLTPL